MPTIRHTQKNRTPLKQTHNENMKKCSLNRQQSEHLLVYSLEIKQEGRETPYLTSAGNMHSQATQSFHHPENGCD